jgi:hypothetical protein
LIVANITSNTAMPPHKATSGQRHARQLWPAGAGAAPKVRFTSPCNSLRVAGCISASGPACSLRFLA